MNEPERYLPSASNAHLRAKCAGAWALIEALRAEGRISEETTQAALDGVAIHAAREGVAPELRADLAETKAILDEMEERLVLTWSGGEEFVLLGREERLWLRRGIIPIHTGRYDYAYRSASWKRILIADDKAGRVEVPRAELNDQMRELGALIYATYPGVEEITVAINQPWVSRQPSMAVYDETEGELSVRLLLKNLGDIADETAIRTPGAHCQYCPAAEYCEENRALVNRVWKLSEKIERGEYTLPVGKVGREFLSNLIMAGKVIEKIVERYKDLVGTDPSAIPGYYLKAGNYRHLITDPLEVMRVTELPLDEFIWAGKFSLPVIIRTFARLRSKALPEAEKEILQICAPFIEKAQNEPSLTRESPRKGKPKAISQPDLI
jgi:hypothetical protein